MHASISRPTQSIRQKRFAEFKLLGVMLLAGLFLSGCTINRDIMFKTGDGYDFASLDNIIASEYRLAPNDILTFQLFANEGERINQATAGSAGGGAGGAGGNNMNNMMGQGGMSYTIRQNGILQLPEIGDIRLEGLTIIEAEGLLEEAYSSFYNRPYVIIRVTNKRVLMFPGESGRASVISLANNNTSLLEVLALAGGIGANANASKVKLIRRYEDSTKVYQMDFSTIEGLSDAQLVVQANDIIYVEPLPNLVQEVTQNISPITGLISTLTFLYAFILNPPN